MAGEEQVGNIVYQVQMDVANLIEAQRKVNERLEKMSGGASKAASKFDQLQASINKVAGAIAASLVVDWGKAFLVAADNMSQLNARIERLTGSAAAASQTMQSLMRISSATGGSLQDTAKLWETLSTALRDTGATNGQIIQLTDTLQKIGRIGGSSSEEMANALRQFGQSISSGVVRAEEFNSILEQMPELARQIAAGMGVSIGELRQLMLDGKLTAEDALNAIQKQTGSVNAEFEKLPRTLSQANTALTNSFLSMIDSVNQATGASSGMVAVIDSLTAALDRLTGKTASASAQISDLNSSAEMFERRARTYSWLGLDGWEAQSKAIAGVSNKAALLVGDLDAVTKASKVAANTKPIEIKTTATGSKPKAGKSAAQKEAEQYAKAQESVNQKLDELKQKAELSAGSVGELSRAQAVLNAQQSLGNDATQEQVILAGQYAAKAWDNANALRAQAKAEKERTEAANKFSTIQGTTAAWTPAAIMSSIASFGGAVAIGIGAMAGILALSGKRKNGGPVSAGGMYQVGEGGMPEIYQASTGKQYMIPGDNGKVISNKDMTAGGGGGVILNINNYSSASVDAQATQGSDGTWTIDAFIADMNNGGPASQAITSNMNVKRTPRGQG